VVRKKRKETRFTNGIPELLILALLDRGEMYGYQIVKEIQETTRDELAFGEGCIYPLLRSLQKKGQIRSRPQEVDGRVRLYYALSEKGRRQLDEVVTDWKRVTHGVRRVLDRA
jgi:PadR family transcriptional regulator PadR